MKCSVCQNVKLTKRHKIGICRPCYVKRVIDSKRKPKKYCKECNIEVCNKSRSSLCRECYLKDFNSKDVNKKRRSDAAKKRIALDREGHNRKSREWQKANPEKHHKIKMRTIRGPRDRFTRSRRRGEQRGFDWSISYADFQMLIVQICHYCNGPLNETGVALDRKDNTKGYILDNVVPCCFSCNKVKSDVLTYEEMVDAMKAVLIHRQRSKIHLVKDG